MQPAGCSVGNEAANERKAVELPHVQPREAGVMGVSLNRAASRIALVIFALAVVGLMAFGDGQASASHVSCGDKITADTTLDSDLVDCPNNGIVIGADGVTLDLNGHLIDGDGTEARGCDRETELCDFGVANDGHDGVTVRDGSVREFGVGVFVGGARKNRVLNISASGHDFFGAVVGGSSRSVIRGGSFSRNIAPEGDGIGLFGSRPHPDRAQQDPPQPGAGHPRVRFQQEPDQGKRVLAQRTRNPDGGSEPQRRAAQPRHSSGGGILVAPGNRNVIAQNRVSRAVGQHRGRRGRGNLVVGNVVGRARQTGIRLGVPRVRR